MRIRLMIGSLILALGLISAQVPARHSVADISPCGNCASAQVVTSFAVSS
jgi:hypothetical protein